MIQRIKENREFVCLFSVEMETNKTEWNVLLLWIFPPRCQTDPAGNCFPHFSKELQPNCRMLLTESWFWFCYWAETWAAEATDGRFDHNRESLRLFICTFICDRTEQRRSELSCHRSECLQKNTKQKLRTDLRNNFCTGWREDLNPAADWSIRFLHFNV